MIDIIGARVSETRRTERHAFIRGAQPDEAAALTQLALRSKASWGYDAAFMEACIPSLTIQPERIAHEHFFVIEEDDQVAGFVALRVAGPDAELTDLFVEPWAMRRGRGKQLWQHAIGVARAVGVRQLRIEADPFAEGFYRTMGAVRTGEAPSEAIPGRMIPLLTYTLA